MKVAFCGSVPMRIRTALLAGLLSGFFIGPALAVTFQSGDVFASVNNGEVQVYRAGVLIQTLNTGQGGFTTGSTTDAAGNFYVTNFSANSVSKFDPSGVGLGIAASGFNTPESIVFAQNGTAYVSQVGGTSIATFTNPNAVPNGQRSDWIDLAANQTTILYTNEGNTIFATTTAGAPLTPFATALPGSDAFALRILADGSVLVADSQFALHLDSLGNIIKTYTVANVQSLFALNINPDGTISGRGTMEQGYCTSLTLLQATCFQRLTLELGAETSLAFLFTGNFKRVVVEWEGAIPRCPPHFLCSPPASVRWVCLHDAGSGREF